MTEPNNPTPCQALKDLLTSDHFQAIRVCISKLENEYAWDHTSELSYGDHKHKFQQKHLVNIFRAGRLEKLYQALQDVVREGTHDD